MGQVLDVVLGRYRTLYTDNPQLRPFKAQFDALLLSCTDVGQLYDLFNTIDTDRSGCVSVRELFANLSTEATYFRDRVFTLFDDDGSGKIDFREFVLSLWNYCTLSKASLVMFAFDLYDTDSTGELSPEEIEGMLYDLYGKQATHHPQAKHISKELRILDRKTTINVDRFRAFVANHPALLFPAFQMQLALRQHVLGVRFWDRCAEKRIRLVNGTRVPVGMLLEMNVHEEAYLSVLEAHQEAVEEEKQQKLLAFQQTRHDKKHGDGNSDGQKSRAKSIVDWLKVQRVAASATAAAEGSSSPASADKRPVPPVPTSSTVHPANENANQKNNATAASSGRLLHPKDEMALLLLQVTGTYHYRRAWTQHHVRQYQRRQEMKQQALEEEDTKKKKKPIVVGRPDVQRSQPIVVPPLLTLSSNAVAVSAATTNVSTNGTANNYMFGDESLKGNNSQTNSNHTSGPVNAQLYHMLLQGDALQREHKFVELGVLPAMKPARHSRCSSRDENENDDDHDSIPDDSRALKPAGTVSLDSTPRNVPVKKLPTGVVATEDTSTIQMPSGAVMDIPVAIQSKMTRKEVLQWQARMVEYAGILNHVHDKQQEALSQQQSPPKKRPNSASNSLHKQAVHHHHQQQQQSQHRHTTAGLGGVRLLGDLAGSPVASPRIQHVQQQQSVHGANADDGSGKQQRRSLRKK